MEHFKRPQTSGCSLCICKMLQPRIDYLPMWEMYGDHARGCCLVIDWETSKWMEEEAEPVLYHVCYLRKQGNSYVVLNEDNEKLSRSCRAINSQLQELHNVAEEIAEQDRRYLDDVLGKSSTSSKTAATATSKSCGSSTRRRTTSSTLTATNRGFSSRHLFLSN